MTCAELQKYAYGRNWGSHTNSIGRWSQRFLTGITMPDLTGPSSLCRGNALGLFVYFKSPKRLFYVVAKPRVISTITVTPASFLLCQYRRHDPGRHLCVSTSTFFFIPYGMPQSNVVRSRSPVSQECIACLLYTSPSPRD